MRPRATSSPAPRFEAEFEIGHDFAVVVCKLSFLPSADLVLVLSIDGFQLFNFGLRDLGKLFRLLEGWRIQVSSLSDVLPFIS